MPLSSNNRPIVYPRGLTVLRKLFVKVGLASNLYFTIVHECSFHVFI